MQISVKHLKNYYIDRKKLKHTVKQKYRFSFITTPRACQGFILHQCYSNICDENIASFKGSTLRRGQDDLG
jgi:hypothetical protein